jgi:hypothetical protein
MSDLFLTQSDLNTVREIVEVDTKEDLYLNNNLMSFISKKPMGGVPWRIPIRLSSTALIGADDVGALAAAAGSPTNARSQFGAFTVDPCQMVGVAKVPQAAISASREKAGGTIDLLVDAIKDVRQRLAQRIEFMLSGNGFGGIGVFISHTGSSSPYVLQMATLFSVQNLNKGDVLVSAASDSSSSLDSGTIQISAVDRDAGTVTVAVLSGGWTPTDGHTLYYALDKLAGNVNVNSVPYGLEAWLPTVAGNRTATFAGVDRSQDPQNLAGVLVSGAATDILSTVNRALAKLGPKRDAMPKVAFMNDNTYAALQAQLFNKVRFESTEIEGEVNFEGIKFRTAKGSLECATSWSIPDGMIRILSRDSFDIANVNAGELVQSAINNGQDLIDSTDQFGATIRQWAYFQLGCKAPGLSATCLLT